MNIRANSEFRPGNQAAILEGITKRALAAVTEGTAAIKETALQLAPYRDGALVSSIGSEVSIHGLVAEGTVFAAAPHAAFLEFGTGLVGRDAPHGALPETGTPFTGSWVFDFRNQGWVGMPAQPYMRPALDYSGPAVLDAFRAQGFKV